MKKERGIMVQPPEIPGQTPQPSEQKTPEPSGVVKPDNSGLSPAAVALIETMKRLGFNPRSNTATPNSSPEVEYAARLEQLSKPSDRISVYHEHVSGVDVFVAEVEASATQVFTPNDFITAHNKIEEHRRVAKEKFFNVLPISVAGKDLSEDDEKKLADIARAKQIPGF